MAGRPPHFTRLAPHHGRSSPFPRLTTAHEELAGYVHAPAVKRPSTMPSLARMEHEMQPDQNGGLKSAFGSVGRPPARRSHEVSMLRHTIKGPHCARDFRRPQARPLVTRRMQMSGMLALRLALCLMRTTARTTRTLHRPSLTPWASGRQRASRCAEVIHRRSLNRNPLAGTTIPTRCKRCRSSTRMRSTGDPELAACAGQSSVAGELVEPRLRTTLKKRIFRSNLSTAQGH